MKKIINIVIAIVLLGNISLADNPVELRIPDTTATIGEYIDIPVYVDNSVIGENIYSYQFRIYHNATRLLFVSIEIAGTMAQTWGTPASNVSGTNYLNIAGAGSTPLSGTGVLFYIRFQCVNSGGSSLTFDGTATNNYFNEGTPAITFDNGYISIAALPTINVTPNNGLLTVGDNMQFNVSGGTAPYSWFVTNPAIASINSLGLLTANTHGFTKVVTEDIIGTRDTITGWVEIRAMQLSIPDTSEWQGGTIDIPINTTSLAGLNIMSGNFSFIFNQNILTPTALITTGTLLNGYTVSFNNTFAGNVNIAFAGTAPINGSGTLCYVRFEISQINTGVTGLTFTEALFNEDLQATTDDGYFTMISYSNIYLSPNTASLVAGESLLFTASGGVPPYSWSTSDPNVATIDGGGMLTAHQSGIIQVTVTDQVGATKTSGDITIYDTYVSLPNVYATLGSIYDMPVLISVIPAGQSIYAVQGTISCKTSELEIIDIITTGTLTDGWTFSKNIAGNNISFAGAGTVPFTSAGAMFKVKFQLTPDLTQGENAWVHIDDIILNEGFPLPTVTNGSITGTGGIILDLKANLEGTFDAGEMKTNLNPWKLPNSQPYNISPWYYNGNESFAAVPNGDIVDWVLVELRETPGTASTAIPATRIDRQAGLLLKDGSIVGTDGISNLIIGITVTQNLYIIIWHRNHLGIMSAVPVTLSGGKYIYDFTTGAAQVYGGISGHVHLGNGVYGMAGGDANADGAVNAVDKTVWQGQAGVSGYKSSDLNMDGQVTNTDKNELYIKNEGMSSQIPQ